MNIIVAWNPSNDSQFAASSSSSNGSATDIDKLHLFSRTTGSDHHFNDGALDVPESELHIKEIKSWNAPQISCLDWSPAFGTNSDNSIIAYGNNNGDVSIINTRHDNVRHLF